MEANLNDMPTALADKPMTSQSRFSSLTRIIRLAPVLDDAGVLFGPVTVAEHKNYIEM